MEFLHDNEGDYLFLNPIGCNTIDEALLKYRKEINERLVDCIDISFNGDLNEIVAFYIADPGGTDKDFEVTVYKDNWNEIIDQCLDYYESEENYEECSRVKELKDRINTDFRGHPEYPNEI